MTTTSPATRNPIRLAAGILLGLLALVLAGGTVYFTLVAPAEKLVAWAVVALAATVSALASVPGVVRGSRLSWTVALCWTTALLYWSLYKITVEGETESVVFLAAEILIVVLLLCPAGRPGLLPVSSRRGRA